MSMADIRSGYVTADQLYYSQAGKGDSLILVHSGLSNSRMWDQQFPVFSDHYLTVRYDLRGCGFSKVASGQFSHVEDLERVIDALVRPPVHLVGSSLGGRVALDFAVRRPDMVRSLALVGTDISGYEYEAEPPAQWPQLVAAYKAGDLDLVARLETDIWLVGRDRTREDVDPRVYKNLMRQNLLNLRAEKMGRGQEVKPEPPAVTQLTKIDIPTLAIFGEYDQIDIQEMSQLIVAQVPSAEKHVIPDSAHLPNLERPDLFNETILTWLKKVS